MANQDVRGAAKVAGGKLWQVAEGLGMADSAFSRKLRHEPPEGIKRQALAVIERLRKEGGKDHD